MKARRVPKLRVTPLARKCAAAAGVDLSSVTGTGPKGRIVSADVIRAVNAKAEIRPDYTAELLAGSS